MDDNKDDGNVFKDAAVALASVKDLVSQGEAISQETRGLVDRFSKESKTMLGQLSENSSQMRAMHSDILAARQEVVTVAGQVNESVREGSRHRDEVLIELRRSRRLMFWALLGVTVSLLALFGVLVYFIFSGT